MTRTTQAGARRATTTADRITAADGTTAADAQPLLAGVDIGTTSVKVLLMTPEGADIALGRAATTWDQVPTGAQADAGRLTAATESALADALSQVRGAQVVGLGVASMAEAGVLTDEADTPVAPVIAWHDNRDELELADLKAHIGGDRFSRRTGLPLWTQWSLTKHRWLVKHHAPAASAAHRYNIAEWIVRGLGGERATELSLASRTGWLDLRERGWWSETLDWSSADASLMGPLVSAGTPLGTARVTGPLAALDGAVLTVAGHDHQAAAVGLGCHRPGDEFDSCGTAEALLRTAEPGLSSDAVHRLAAAGVTVGWHAARGRWCLLGATQGGLVLGKVLDALGVERAGLAALDEAAAQASDRPDVIRLGPGAGDVAIDPAGTPGEVWRAATRAVSSQAADLAEVLTQAAGPRGRLVVAGGWTNSTQYLDAKREQVGEFAVGTESEAGCRGAAIFAGLAAGIYTDLTDAPAPTRS